MPTSGAAPSTTPEHGGRLREAARRYGRPPADWLDLSTGINPRGYPAGTVPADIWNRLPEDHDGLEHAAAAYYGTDQLLPVPGTQAALSILPQLLPGERVAMLCPTYSGHPHAWQNRHLGTFTQDSLEAVAQRADIVVIANPNNPTGARFEPDRLLALHRTLLRRGGWLVVDEAFTDTVPELSVAASAGREHLVILRSVGKFFGLGGARVGFVLAPRSLREAISLHLGPWSVAGPSRHVVRTALLDRAWQAETRLRLARDGYRLAALLAGCGFDPPAGTSLFQWVLTPAAQALHEAMAQCGILVRRFDHPASLRFGLPCDEAGWERLTMTLQNIRNEHGI